MRLSLAGLRILGGLLAFTRSSLIRGGSGQWNIVRSSPTRHFRLLIISSRYPSNDLVTLSTLGQALQVSSWLTDLTIVIETLILLAKKTLKSGDGRCTRPFHFYEKTEFRSEH